MQPIKDIMLELKDDAKTRIATLKMSEMFERELDENRIRQML